MQFSSLHKENFKDLTPKAISLFKSCLLSSPQISTPLPNDVNSFSQPRDQIPASWSVHPSLLFSKMMNLFPAFSSPGKVGKESIKKGDGVEKERRGAVGKFRVPIRNLEHDADVKFNTPPPHFNPLSN
ncbi:hypothetical protein TNCT_521421 [Trichonephila clavata]|uniref:Uncharacterized protein n=1 Tax=Trichonephila clavata TaxID=2740835 RepID=A0A8X6GI25_TRICU|nr:hypothetical protein TNCT_521421 [Trichonephila clavata]